MTQLELPRWTATAASHPCQLYAHHAAPRPTRTQGHHRFPEYLQRRVWGETRDGRLLWLCGLCHDSVHDWISWTLGDARKPDPEPGTAVRREAQHAVALFRLAQEGWLP